MNGKGSFPSPNQPPRTMIEPINNLETIYEVLRKKASINIAHSIKIGLLSGVAGLGKFSLNFRKNRGWEEQNKRLFSQK